MSEPDRGPDVVDDADLRVHVDRRAGPILDAVDTDPVAARGPDLVQRLQPPDEIRRLGEPAVLIGEVRNHHDQVQRGIRAQRVGETAHHVLAQKYWSST